MDSYQGSEKYYTTKQNLRETLEKYGLAVIPSVLDENECKQMETNMWDYLKHVGNIFETPIVKNLENTYENISDLYLDYKHNSLLINFWGISHSRLCWDVRQNPKIVDTFAHFWDCDPHDLLVSFDGASIQLPPEITGFGWGDDNSWFHTDQTFTDNEFRFVQSWVTARDVCEGDATLAFLEGSHLFHADFAEEFGIASERNYNQINEEEHLQFYLDRGCVEKKIVCPKGSLVLWDSRTIHYGAGPLSSRPVKNIRCVVYLCYVPRSRANEDILEEKKNIFLDGFATNHNPCNIKPLPPTPYRLLYEWEKPEPPALTYLGRRLIGYN